MTDNAKPFEIPEEWKPFCDYIVLTLGSRFADVLAKNTQGTITHEAINNARIFFENNPKALLHYAKDQMNNNPNFFGLNREDADAFLGIERVETQSQVKIVTPDPLLDQKINTVPENPLVIGPIEEGVQERISQILQDVEDQGLLRELNEGKPISGFRV